jgi:hypothetical protein
MKTRSPPAPRAQRRDHATREQRRADQVGRDFELQLGRGHFVQQARHADRRCS